MLTLLASDKMFQIIAIYFRLKTEKPNGYTSGNSAHSNGTTPLKNLTTNKFVKFYPQHEVELEPAPEPMRAVIQEQYDNVPSDIDDVDFLSRDVTLTLNQVNSEWSSEGDLPEAVAKSWNRIDLCTNKPIMTNHCTSLPDHYVMSKLKKKSSALSEVKIK